MSCGARVVFAPQRPPEPAVTAERRVVLWDLYSAIVACYGKIEPQTVAKHRAMIEQEIGMDISAIDPLAQKQSPSC